MKFRKQQIMSVWWSIILAISAGAVSIGVLNITESGIMVDGAPFVGVLGLLASMIFFVVYGRGTITPASMVFYSLFVFIFLPSLLIGFSRGYSSHEVLVTYVGFIATIAFGLVLNRSPITVSSTLTHWLWQHRRTIGTIGIGSALTYSLLHSYNPLLQGLLSLGIEGSSLLFVILGAAAIKQGRLVWAAGYLAVSVVISLLWYMYFFSGFGRINMAALLLSACVIYLLVHPSRRAKIAMVLFTPVGLIWGGFVELTRSGGYVENWREIVPAIVLKGTGLGSLLAPFQDWARVLSYIEMTPWFSWWEWGGQFLSSLFFFIPRSWWPSKPEGFGRLLVYTLEPQLASSGHSMAASVFGEGAAYFGPFGVLFGFTLVSVVAWILRRLQDEMIVYRSSLAVLLLLCTAWGSGQILTLIWGGLFTFAVRTLGLAIGLLPWVLMWFILSRLSRPCRPRGFPVPVYTHAGDRNSHDKTRCT